MKPRGLADRLRKSTQALLLVAALASCTAVDRRPWVGSWGQGDGFSAAGLCLASNGRGLLGGGMVAIPIQWRVRGDLVEIAPAKIEGLEELGGLKGYARLIDGGRFIELTGLDGGGRPTRLPLKSRDDSLEEVDRWTRELQTAIKGERAGPRPLKNRYGWTRESPSMISTAGPSCWLPWSAD